MKDRRLLRAGASGYHSAYELPTANPILEHVMIRGVHTMFYTSQPEATRAFFRDKLGFPFTDVGENWLIFEVPEADLGFHPSDTINAAPSGTPLISFFCDSIEKTIAELSARGVSFTGPVEDHGYGLVTFFKVPGDFAIQLYQPKYVKNPITLPPPPVEKPAVVEPPPAPSPAPKQVAAKPKPKPVPVKAKAKKPAPAKRVAMKPAKAAPKKVKKAKGRRR